MALFNISNYIRLLYIRPFQTKVEIILFFQPGSSVSLSQVTVFV